MKFPPDGRRISWPDSRKFAHGYASGLIYFYGMWTNMNAEDGVPVICNPETGRYEALPYIYRYRKSYSFFGFDPINKQYKALFMAYPYCPDDHRIVTLGTGEMRWRKIKCSMHHKLSEGVCINGVLYYLGDTAGYDEEMSEELVIVCFDVRLEKFKFIYPERFCELINYKGKLGAIYRDNITDDTIELRVWVLEDVEKHEWSKYAYTLRGTDHFFLKCVSVIGVTSTGEIILSMANYTSKKPFYVFYFNPERKTLQREHLETSTLYYSWRVDVFADHVEDLNVIDPKLLKSSIYASYVYTEESEEEETECDERGFRCFFGKRKKKKADDERKEEESR